jgi:hypothetical protein
VIEMEIPITEEEAKLLEFSGFLERAEDGVYEMTSKGVSFTLDYLKRKEKES